MDQEDGELGGYLVLMRCDNLASSCRWSGDVIEIEPTADCTITLSRIVVGGRACKDVWVCVCVWCLEVCG